VAVGREERSQALAKTALALMAECEVPPNPENFHLFYTYSAGENPAISRVMGEMIAQKKSFTPQALEVVRDHFLGPNRLQRAVEDIGSEITDTIATVLNKLAAAERDTEDYGRALTAATGAFGSDQSPAGFQNLVKSLLGATQAMEARTKSLEEELQRSSHEIGELRTKLDHVRRESLVDPLTGISNRKAFDTELADAVEQSRTSGEPLCLFMCDIDHFKSFNDTWGHQTGDQVLKLVAQCLSENVKGRDTAARYGGEEFAVILRQTPLRAGITLANQIRSNVEAKKLVRRSNGDLLGQLTISIGVAELQPNDATSDLIERADSCLYSAKKAGRNRVVGELKESQTPESVVAA
jgi:diguanylate cyclase